MSFGKRPELTAPPEIFYNESEARKYADNSRMMRIQAEMAERAIELLSLPEDEPQMILDLGCGSGLSGAELVEAGHMWVGLDISQAMLTVAKQRFDEDDNGELILSDMGQGVPFRAGSFDAAISISALQWLCNADKSSHKPTKRLYTFFTSLYAALVTGGRAVLQFYPADQHQTDLITAQAKRAGFNGGLVVDFPESTKAKKYYLVLIVGGQANPVLPKSLSTTGDKTVSYSETSHRNPKNKRAARSGAKSVKDWIQDKKERRRRQGRETRPDSKYTGRKRSAKF